MQVSKDMAGFTGGEIVGGGRLPDRQCVASWHRFYLDDPAAEILARYADGKPAMAVKRLGKGAIVYSAVPLTLPQMYRNIARYAGVHLYLDTDDALYADGDFVMIHTLTAGAKQVRLRQPAAEIREVFTGETAGRNTAEFTVNLPSKHTAVYYVGADPAFLQRLAQVKR